MKKLLSLLAARMKQPGWLRSFTASGVIALCSVISFAMLQHKDGFPLTSLILAGGICALLCRLKIFTLPYLIVLMLLTAVERHFILHYNVSFRESGTQALITLNITDKEEVFSYLSLLRWQEYLCVALFLAAIVLQFIPRFNRPGPAAVKGLRHYAAGAGALLFLLLFAGFIAWNPVLNFEKEWRTQKEFLLRRNQFLFHAVDPAPDSPAVHFLLIGESHRKDEFDAIVLKGGSPILTAARKNGSLFEFDDMISYYQQTWFSVFTLLSRRGAEDMSTNFSERGLFALFREAGWKVYYITYQPKTISFSGYDCIVNEADEYVDAREETGIKRDNAFLACVDQILAKKEKKVLIVMKMSGCHFHYSDRYPQTERYRKYLPAYDEDQPGSYKIGEKEILVNTYRNAMLFSAEVFDELSRRCRDLQVPSFFFFLSDHGIINFDDGGNPFFGAVKSNFHIPCVLFVNEAYRQKMSSAMAGALQRNRSLPCGNDSVFDTMVSLAGLRYPNHRKETDLTSSDAVPKKNRKVWVWKKKIPYDSLP